jgi:alpha-galactosidase
MLNTNRQGDKPGRGWIAGHFIMYVRSGDTYLVIASMDRITDVPSADAPSACLPPVGFRIQGKKQIICAELFCPGKVWEKEECMAELRIFTAGGFFDFKDKIGSIYKRKETFARLDFLGKRPGGYESWYNHYTNISEGLLLEDLEALGRNDNIIKLRYLDRGLPAVFQIDDGWEKTVGNWEVDEERFPGGLKSLALKIEARGLIPGLWLAPFIVRRNTPVFTEKPEWILRDGKGNPVPAGWNHLWDGRYYCLDLSRGDVLEYLDALMSRVINEWGFRYIKLDFLYAGFLSGAFAEGGSPYEHYDRACAMLTSRTKTSSLLPVVYLGCGAPLGPSFRHFPLCRIGADTRETWDWKLPRLLGHVGGPGALISLRDTIGRSFMNGTIYISDPDVIFLRTKNCGLTKEEKECIALTNFLLGAQIMFSDDPVSLTEEDLTLTKRINSLYDKLSGDEYGAVMIKPDVYRIESRDGTLHGVINLKKHTIVFSASRIGKEKSPYRATAPGRGG